MIEILPSIPEDLSVVKKTPQKLYSLGDITLLEMPRISIVGTRRPTQYTKEMTTALSRAFSEIGYVVVSGGAMGVDALAHQGAFPHTIGVMANSLDIYYPAVNKKLLQEMAKEALLLSEYEEGTRATKYSFVLRNRIVVALGEALIITQADENSGSMRSAEIALELGKKIYVLSHRIGESLGTQKLLAEKKAEAITSIEELISRFGKCVMQEESELAFFRTAPTLQESIEKFGDKIYEWELEGKLIIKNLKVTLS